MKHKNVQVGQRVIVKRSTSEYWDTAGRHIGKEFTVGEVEPLDYPGEGTVRLENAGGHGFWCNHKDIKLVREQAAPVPKELSWPWPAGTRVRLSDSGNGRASLFDISPQAEYILGSDGSDYPPLMTFAGVRVFYVRERHVVLA
jgi:hypothetical protein